MIFIATISRCPDSSLAEIFLAGRKDGSQIDAAARDSAVVASLALQHGAPVETLRRALLRDAQGLANGPLGTALDLTDECQS
jgi:ribonucleoside-diphosphate reductase alpha chain